MSGKELEVPCNIDPWGRSQSTGQLAECTLFYIIPVNSCTANTMKIETTRASLYRLAKNSNKT